MGFPRVDILQIAGVFYVDFRFCDPYFPQRNKSDRPWSVHRTDKKYCKHRLRGSPICLTCGWDKNKLSLVSTATNNPMVGVIHCGLDSRQLSIRYTSSDLLPMGAKRQNLTVGS